MKSNEPEIIDVEVISSKTSENDSSARNGGFGPGDYRQDRGFGPQGFQNPFGGQRRATYRNFIINTPESQIFSVASIITLSIFFACLYQWGFLAGLGFLFFYVAGAALGMYWQLRRIVSGKIPNPWPWRIGNWIVCTLLVKSLV